MSRRSFLFAIAAIAAVAFVVRIAYILAVARHLDLGVDSVWYTLASGPLADGKGYIAPGFYFLDGREVPTAAYPPLYPAFIAIVSRLPGATFDWFRYAGALAGTATVVLTGFIGRRIAGPHVGLVAAALAAVYPSLIAVDGSLMSETVSIPLLYAAVLLAVIAVERPTWWRFVASGALFGAMLLARADAFVPALFVLGAAAWATRGRFTRRAGLGLLGLAAMAGIAVPWVVRNAADLDTATIATISTSATIGGANCDATYSGKLLGEWDFGCMDPDRNMLTISEAQWSREARERGVEYAQRHAGQVPFVVFVRELRVLGLYHPFSQLEADAVETRSFGWQIAGWACWLPVMVLGAIGLARLARMHRHAWPVLGVVAALLVTVALSHGNQRFRTGAEPAMLIAAAAVVVPRRAQAPSSRS